MMQSGEEEESLELGIEELRLGEIEEGSPDDVNEDVAPATTSL